MAEFRWHFNEMRPCDKAREPIQGEFFAADAISDPGEALVREGIQNSLDARRNGEKVRVRICVSGQNAAVPRKAVAPYLDGLECHLRAPGNGLREIPGDEEACPFLVFEDFGTTGLLGDPAEWKPASDSQNHFYHFFRAEGRSDKCPKDIGRWGVGKQVFPRASRINTVLGLTVRSDDRKQLLMGMAILKSHDVKGVRYGPDGWLGQSSENSASSLVLPIEDPSFIDQFSRAFGIERGDNPGVTIVVPWCDLDLTDENLVRAVLRGYFWPILRGELEVVVKSRTIETRLDSDSLETEIQKMGNDLERDILPLVDLAKWARGRQESAFVKLETPDPNRAWEWTRELLGEHPVKDLRQRYERGEKIAVRIPVYVREKKKDPRDTFFDVFLFRDGSDHSGRPVFIRKGIIIPDVRAPRTRGVRAIVNAEDEPIAAFLCDSENPAHTQWQKDGANFRGKYVSGASDLQFVMRSVHEIVALLADEGETNKCSVWVNLFSIPMLTEEERTKTKASKKKEKEGTHPEEPTPPETPHPKLFVIERIEGGFVVRNGAGTGSPPPKALLIRAAYHVRRGNPFKKYHPADFDVSKRIKVEVKGGTVLEKTENRLYVRIDNSDFRIEVTGFDPKRDLRVDVRPQEAHSVSPDA